MRYFAVTLMILLSACQSKDGWFDYSRPATLDTTPPPGPVEYQLGWNDGCNSGLAAVNTSMNLMLASHTYKIDGNGWQNPKYKSAWKDAYYYCTYHMFSSMMNTF